MMSEPEVMKYTGFKKTQTIEQVHKSLEGWKKDRSVWCAEAVGNGEFIGWFMLKTQRYEQPELGFMLPKKNWGRGLATEVARAIIAYAFKQGVQKIIATTLEDNVKSISVLNKIGMKHNPGLKDSSKERLLFFEAFRNPENS